MIRLFSHRHRAVHESAFPLERMPRTTKSPVPPAHAFTGAAIEHPEAPLSIRNAMRDYVNIMDRMRIGPKAPAEAPIPADQLERANHLKAACHYLDASMVGSCIVPAAAILSEPIVNESLAEAMEMEYAAGSADNKMAESVVREGREAWARATSGAGDFDHEYALVILTEYTREPRPEEPGGAWIAGSQAQRAAVRGAEVGAVMTNYLRFLGFDARLHTATASDLDLDQMVEACGLAARRSSNVTARPENPFIGDRFGVVVVSTTMPFAADDPLDAARMDGARNFSWWLGFGGTRPGYAGAPFEKRDFHLGPYPMETVRRVDEPTTIIDAPKVPRVPKRHDMFLRAAMGDLGAKAQHELDGFRMITKNPFGHAMIPVLGGMVPLQYGEGVERDHGGYGRSKKECGGGQGSALLPRRRHGRHLRDSGLRLVLARHGRFGNCAVSQVRDLRADRPGLRNHGRRQWR